ncbi:MULTISPECIES: hypothetical protein [Dysgonomonas]|uniref:Uncharacterized protein n=1 Tax=Dysgonomonas gadei ATCC BAA-286 TaxID=742766 RepID=F5IW33_9BACT|nr:MULTISPECIES: hypothetical protein [Dysgonomonas]EGK02833.1 hypothetical protein HMPREF9455_01083 [Dysgonomonas gadei ATCC BAA-286]MBF0648474.1 hypothetical protein [Dysgonomonas sp. GY75]
MIKARLLFILITFCSLQTFATPPRTKIEKDKVTLTYIEVKDEAIEFAASDIHSMILRKNKGFLWPATKIAFSRKNGQLYFDVTAIDNSWCNMFRADENPYGYFVIGGRMFIVTSKGNEPIDLAEYFTCDNDIERTFYKPDATVKPVSKNPVWYYLHKGKMATVLDSINIASLGR